LSERGFLQQVPLLRAQVVTVRTPSGTGSGFFISEDLLMTNEHVVVGSSAVRLRFFGGREIGGQVVRSDARRDVALVRAESPEAGRGLPLRLDAPMVGSEVFVIGSPLGEAQEGSVTKGIVSALRNDNGLAVDRGPFIQSDVAVTNGNSGGPMFDDKGNVVGITDLGLIPTFMTAD
jgi:S1-C subfamily serine protease